MRTHLGIITAVLLLLTLGACERENARAPDDPDLVFQQDRQADPGAARPPAMNEIPPRDPVQAAVVEGRQQVTILVAATEYDPPMVQLRPNMPADLTFIRSTEGGCADEIQIPVYGVQTHPLPLNQPVRLTFTPDREGVFTFVCGMDMMKGRIVVQR